MTARDGVISVGLRASASASASRQRTGAIRIGFLVAGTSPPWAGRATANRQRVPWLPSAGVPVALADGRMNPVWYRALQEVFENRLGGINGATVSEVVTSVTQTQAEVIATSTYAAQVSAYAQGVGATAAATAQVAQNNSLSGATAIPKTPDPPPPPGTQPI